MEIDRKAFSAGLGGPTAVSLMSDEAKADALEEFLATGSRSARRAHEHFGAHEILGAAEHQQQCQLIGDIGDEH